jgi:hypothetical protein
MTMKTFRYWTWVNVRWASGRRHDEGWSQSYESVERVGDVLVSVVGSRGRDCDGYTASEGMYEAQIAEAESAELNFATVGALTGVRVSWVERSGTCCDEYAELDGY